MRTRYYGLDVAKGIAVLIMVLSHSFMGTVAQWNSKILLSLTEKIPSIILFCVMIPVILLSQMGSFFSFISAICVTVSFLRISKKGWSVAWRYIGIKIIVAFILRGIEIFWNNWTIEYDPFETRKLQWPIASIPFYGNTLDCIGFIGWSIPLVLYLINLAPFLADYRIQVAIMFTLSLVITFFSHSISDAAAIGEKWCKDNSLFFCEYLMSKISSGPFQTFQIWPFGLLGACVGIFLHSGLNITKLLYFFIIVVIINGISGMILLTNVDDFITELFETFKPEGYMLIIMIIELIFVIWILFLIDSPQRTLHKKLGSLRRTTFLRRLNTLSLTIYIIEPVLSKKIFILFQLLFGKGVNYETKECLWNWPVVTLFSLVVTLVVVGIAKLWEHFDFRFSVEYQLGCIMDWLWNKRYDKLDYKENIYGPMNKVKKEMNDVESQHTKL